jgi:hypothetical protein
MPFEKFSKGINQGEKESKIHYILFLRRRNFFLTKIKNVNTLYLQRKTLRN